jgi:membrane-bound lytic murein transglycosylase D
MIFVFGSLSTYAETHSELKIPATLHDKNVAQLQSLKEKLKGLSARAAQNQPDSLIFDLPVTYNKKVSRWISYYQTSGSKWFRSWLQRSHKFLPFIQKELKNSGLPSDLAYMVMIESGFSPNATSNADAAGPWQFIKPTGTRYGLENNWWLDERRDLKKSTGAAIRYLKDLYEEFGSWYLVAASYNMGENGLRRQIKKYGTKDYWTLIKLSALPAETQEYVPKILAAMLISKAPNLYGFRDISKMDPLEYEVIQVNGGTDLDQLADYIGVTRKSLKDLNAELFLGYIPREIGKHYIRVPKGSSRLVTDYIYQKNQRASIQ